MSLSVVVEGCNFNLDVTLALTIQIKYFKTSSFAHNILDTDLNQGKVAFHWIDYITALENLKYFAAALKHFAAVLYFNTSFLGPKNLPVNPPGAWANIYVVADPGWLHL